VCLPVFFLPNVTLAPDEEGFVLTFAIIYIVKNIIGALEASKEALVIINSITVPGDKNITDPEFTSKSPLPSLNAEI
jgi:hypothetical protein